MNRHDAPEMKEAQMLLNARARFAACKVADDAARQGHMEDHLFMGGRVPTKWERRKRAVKAFFRRFHIAWRVIRGDDIEAIYDAD